MTSEDHELMGLKVDIASQRERKMETGRCVCSDPYKTGSVPCSVCRWLCCFPPMLWPNLYQKSHAPSHLLTNRPETPHTVTLADKQTRNTTHCHTCWQTDQKCHAPSHLLTNWPEKSRTVTLVDKATREVTHHHTCQQTDQKSHSLSHLFTNWPEKSHTITFADQQTRKVTHHHICWQTDQESHTPSHLLTDQRSHTPSHLLTNRPGKSHTITFADKQTRKVMHHHTCW